MKKKGLRPKCGSYFEMLLSYEKIKNAIKQTEKK